MINLFLVGGLKYCLSSMHVHAIWDDICIYIYCNILYIHIIIIILYITPFTDIVSIMGIETSNQMRLNHFKVLINAINTWHIDIQQEPLDKMVKISGLIREHW